MRTLSSYVANVLLHVISLWALGAPIGRWVLEKGEVGFLDWMGMVDEEGFFLIGE